MTNTWDLMGYEWTGEYKEVEYTEWFCPTAQTWNLCPGPCPDHQKHEITRTKKVQVKQMRKIDE